MNDVGKNLLLWIVVALVLMAVVNSFSHQRPGFQRLSYTDFMNEVYEQRVARVRIAEDGRTIFGERHDGQRFTTVAPSDIYLVTDLLKHDVRIEQDPPRSGPSLFDLLIGWLPFIVFIGILIFFMRQMQAGAGGRGAMSFGRSRARLLQGEDQVKVTFADVAGCEEAKEEVAELVEFLRDPGKFQKLGGKIPRGVLMVGPPGTGRRCSRRRSPGRRKCPSSRSRARISWRCSSVWAPAGFATCSTRPRSTRPASCSSMRSTPWVVIAARAWAEVMTSASRP